RLGRAGPGGPAGQPGGHLHETGVRNGIRPGRRRGRRPGLLRQGRAGDRGRRAARPGPRRGGGPMNASGVAIRAGIRRGLAEIRQMLTSGPDLLSVLFFPTITLIVMYFLRDSTLPGTDISVGSAAMPGVLGMQ